MARAYRIPAGARVAALRDARHYYATDIKTLLRPALYRPEDRVADSTQDSRLRAVLSEGWVAFYLRVPAGKRNPRNYRFMLVRRADVEEL